MSQERESALKMQARGEHEKPSNFFINRNFESNFGVNSVGVVSSSMGARAALKAASESKDIASLIAVSGIVNVRATLHAVYYEDLIGNVLAGKTKELYDVLKVGLRDCT